MTLLAFRHQFPLVTLAQCPIQKKWVVQGPDHEIAKFITPGSTKRKLKENLASCSGSVLLIDHAARICIYHTQGLASWERPSLAIGACIPYHSDKQK